MNENTSQAPVQGPPFMAGRSGGQDPWLFGQPGPPIIPPSSFQSPVPNMPTRYGYSPRSQPPEGHVFSHHFPPQSVNIPGPDQQDQNMPPMSQMNNSVAAPPNSFSSQQSSFGPGVMRSPFSSPAPPDENKGDSIDGLPPRIGKNRPESEQDLFARRGPPRAPQQNVSNWEHYPPNSHAPPNVDLQNFQGPPNHGGHPNNFMPVANSDKQDNAQRLPPYPGVPPPFGSFPNNQPPPPNVSLPLGHVDNAQMNMMHQFGGAPPFPGKVQARMPGPPPPGVRMMYANGMPHDPSLGKSDSDLVKEHGHLGNNGHLENSFQVPSISSTTPQRQMKQLVEPVVTKKTYKKKKDDGEPKIKKRKRCGECQGCQLKENCGECGPCKSVRSHQICKLRKCDHLKSKKGPNMFPNHAYSQYTPANENLPNGPLNGPMPPGQQIYGMNDNFQGYSAPPSMTPPVQMNGNFDNHENAQDSHQSMNPKFKNHIQNHQNFKDQVLVPRQMPIGEIENNKFPDQMAPQPWPQRDFHPSPQNAMNVGMHPPPVAMVPPQNVSPCTTVSGPMPPQGMQTPQRTPPPATSISSGMSPHVNMPHQTPPPPSITPNGNIPQAVTPTSMPTPPPSVTPNSMPPVPSPEITPTSNYDSSSITTPPASENMPGMANNCIPEEQTFVNNVNEREVMIKNSIGPPPHQPISDGPKLNVDSNYSNNNQKENIVSNSQENSSVHKDSIINNSSPSLPKDSPHPQSNGSSPFHNNSCTDMLSKRHAPIEGATMPRNDIGFNPNSGNALSTKSGDDQHFLLNTTTSMNTYTSTTSTFNIPITSSPLMPQSQMFYSGQNVIPHYNASGAPGMAVPPNIDCGRIQSFIPNGNGGTATSSVPVFRMPSLMDKEKMAGSEGYLPNHYHHPPSFPPISSFDYSSNAISDYNNTDHDWIERMERLRNNTKMQVPNCDCVSAEMSSDGEGPSYYTHLGAGPSVSAIRADIEKRFGVEGKSIRIEKIAYTGREGKTSQGCPMAKWILRRSGLDEKYMVLVRNRVGHRCSTSWIVVIIVAWEGIENEAADSLYELITKKVNNYGTITQRRCGFNEMRTCACQGVDADVAGASYSFGCSWSMYYNGCKFARSKSPRKFKLSDQNEEEELEEKLQNLATFLSPVYQKLVPESYRNQTEFENEGKECRLGNDPGRPFSGVTSCVDFCTHAHKDIHNMNNGCTVVVTLTKHRGLTKPDDEQLHVLPLYVLSDTDEHGSKEEQDKKVYNGSIEKLTKYSIKLRIRSVPASPCKVNRSKKNPAAGLSPGRKLKHRRSLDSMLSPIKSENESYDLSSVRQLQNQEISQHVSSVINETKKFLEYEHFNGSLKGENHVQNRGSSVPLPTYSYKSLRRSVSTLPEMTMKSTDSLYEFEEDSIDAKPPDKFSRPFGVNRISKASDAQSVIKQYNITGNPAHFNHNPYEHAQIHHSTSQSTQQYSHLYPNISPGSWEQNNQLSSSEWRPKQHHNSTNSVPFSTNFYHTSAQNSAHFYDHNPSFVTPLNRNQLHQSGLNPRSSISHGAAQISSLKEMCNKIETPHHTPPIYQMTPSIRPIRPSVNLVPTSWSGNVTYSIQNVQVPLNHQQSFYSNPSSDNRVQSFSHGNDAISPYHSAIHRQPHEKMVATSKLNSYPINFSQNGDLKQPFFVDQAQFNCHRSYPTGTHLTQSYMNSSNFYPNHPSNLPKCQDFRTHNYMTSSPGANSVQCSGQNYLPYNHDPNYPQAFKTSVNHFANPFGDHSNVRGESLMQNDVNLKYPVPISSVNRYPSVAPCPLPNQMGFQSVNKYAVNEPNNSIKITNPFEQRPQQAYHFAPEVPSKINNTVPIKKEFCLEHFEPRPQQVDYLPRTPKKKQDHPYVIELMSYDSENRLVQNYYEVESENEENFKDPLIGGVAIALGHGSILFECAKHELHATTALRNPDRKYPKRISLVFYQHKNLNTRDHGYKEWMQKKEEKQKLKAQMESSNGTDSALLCHSIDDINSKITKNTPIQHTSHIKMEAPSFVQPEPIFHGKGMQVINSPNMYPSKETLVALNPMELPASGVVRSSNHFMHNNATSL